MSRLFYTNVCWCLFSWQLLMSAVEHTKPFWMRASHFHYPRQSFPSLGSSVAALLTVQTFFPPSVSFQPRCRLTHKHVDDKSENLQASIWRTCAWAESFTVQSASWGREQEVVALHQSAFRDLDLKSKSSWTYLAHFPLNPHSKCVGL